MFKSEEEDIWSSILNDVSTGTIDKEKKSLLVLGMTFDTFYYLRYHIYIGQLK